MRRRSNPLSAHTLVDDAPPPLAPSPIASPAALLAGVKIRAMENGARALVTVEDRNKAWVAKMSPLPAFDNMGGAIVRVRPPAFATAVKIGEVEDACRRAGAVAVKVEAHRRADALVTGASPSVPIIAKSLGELIAEELERVSEDPTRFCVAHLIEEALDKGRARAPRSIVPESSEPLWIAGIRLRNWFRFRSVDLRLRPTVYGVVAKLSTDAERSNWLGKSTFLAAPAYVLTGWQPSDYEDAWITPGENEGSVFLELSDGSTMERSRRRGKSTVVTFVKKTGEKLVGDEAKAAILRHIGLTPEDFFASAFVRQDELARLVTDGAAETAKIVSSWLNLAPLREAHKVVLERLDAFCSNEEKWIHEVNAATNSIARINDEIGTPAEDRAPEKRCGADWARAQEKAAKEAHAKATAEMAKIEHAAKAGDEAVKKYREDVDAIARLRATASSLETAQGFLAKAKAEEAMLVRDEAKCIERVQAADKGLPDATAKVHAANADVRQKKQLVAATFNGVCPVAGIECPATKAINDDRGRNADLLVASEKAKREADAAAAPLQWAKSEEENSLARTRGKLAATQKELGSIERTIAGAQKALEWLAGLPEPSPPVTTEGLAERLRSLATEQAGQQALEKTARRAAEGIERAIGTLNMAVAERIASAVEITIHRHAARILGPGGVQRSYASNELAAIEAGANAILEEASAELRVAIEWGYDSPTALAPACGTCGIGFPAASRAKTCQRCGEARPPKFEEKIRILPNRSSGAAKDMGGVATQVSASSWLRTSRGSAWQSCMIDEPFGSLDRSHGRALGSHLASLLGGRLGFRQGFVVAHSTAAMDAMPARLVIIGEPGENGASTIEEEA